MLAEGGICFESPTCAVKAYPQLWASPKALGMVLARQRKVEAEKGMQSAIRVTSSYNNSYIGQCYSVPAPAPSILTAPQGLIRVGFQRLGPKLHHEVAYYDPRRVENAREFIEELVGPLAWYEEPYPQGVTDEEQVFNQILDGDLHITKLPNEDSNLISDSKDEVREASKSEFETNSEVSLNVPSHFDLLGPSHDSIEEMFPILRAERKCNCCGDPHAPFGEGWSLRDQSNTRWYCGECIPKPALAMYQNYQN